MGGNDQFDINVDSIRNGQKEKEQQYLLFAFELEAAGQNAWLVMECSDKTLTFCQFRMNKVQVYLFKYVVLHKKIHLVGFLWNKEF